MRGSRSAIWRTKVRATVVWRAISSTESTVRNAADFKNNLRFSVIGCQRSDMKSRLRIEWLKVAALPSNPPRLLSVDIERISAE
jgi:hypothetical protein